MSVSVKSLKDTPAFTKLKVGGVELGHRIVFPPTTRNRALKDHTPSDLQYQYYDDRSKFPGTLLVVEGTLVSSNTGLYEYVPGIFDDSHVEGWKKINDKIHANGSFSSVQFWGLGRVANAVETKRYGSKLIAPTAQYHSEEAKTKAELAGNPVQELTEQEIHKLIYDDYTKAAKNAVAAGFDFIELHSAHGYLLDTFLQSSTNKRTDKYGGSIENRARFPLELIDHLIEVVGADKLAIRVSPWAKFQNMKAEEDDVHPIAQFGHFIAELEKRGREGKRLGYISLVEPRVSGNITVDSDKQVGDNSFIKTIWKGILMRAGNYTYDAPDFKTLLNDLEDGRTIVGFSRFYISNPDLIKRLHDGLPLAAYDRSTFYNHDNYGYNTWGKYGDEVDEKVEEIESKRFAAPIKQAS